MPDLNLIDEGGFEESSAPAAPASKKKSGGGGGGGKSILIIVLVVVVALGAVYFLNQKGIIKLWGKKQPVVQLEEPYPQDMVDQVPVEQGMPQVDTSEVALLETPTVEEKVEVQTPEAQAKTEEVDAPPGSKLSEMHGDYTIQVVAYREKNKAEEMVKRLEFSGYPSFVEKVPMKGIDWYTVRIGRYPSRDDAKRAVITFADQLQAHYFIDKVRKK